MPISSFFARVKRAPLASRRASCGEAGYGAPPFAAWPRPTGDAPIFPPAVEPQARRSSGRRRRSRSVRAERASNNGDNIADDPLALFDMKPISSRSPSPLSCMTRPHKKPPQDNLKPDAVKITFDSKSNGNSNDSSIPPTAYKRNSETASTVTHDDKNLDVILSPDTLPSDATTLRHHLLRLLSERTEATRIIAVARGDRKLKGMDSEIVESEQTPLPERLEIVLHAFATERAALQRDLAAANEATRRLNTKLTAAQATMHRATTEPRLDAAQNDLSPIKLNSLTAPAARAASDVIAAAAARRASAPTPSRRAATALSLNVKPDDITNISLGEVRQSRPNGLPEHERARIDAAERNRLLRELRASRAEVRRLRDDAERRAAYHPAAVVEDRDKLARERDEARRMLGGALRERRAATARVGVLEASLTARASEVEDAQNLLQKQATAYEAALSDTRAETARLRAHAAAMQARVDSWARDVRVRDEAHQAVVSRLRARSDHLESRIDALRIDSSVRRQHLSHAFTSNNDVDRVTGNNVVANDLIESHHNDSHEDKQERKDEGEDEYENEGNDGEKGNEQHINSSAAEDVGWHDDYDNDDDDDHYGDDVLTVESTYDDDEIEGEKTVISSDSIVHGETVEFTLSETDSVGYSNDSENNKSIEHGMATANISDLAQQAESFNSQSDRSRGDAAIDDAPNNNETTINVACGTLVVPSIKEGVSPLPTVIALQTSPTSPSSSREPPSLASVSHAIV